MRKLACRIALVLAVAFFSVALAGCFGLTADVQVAASVNGEEIAEDDVTDYIEGFRSQNAEYESDSAWAEFLLEGGYTAESLREYLLESVFVPRVLIRQQCSAYGITLTDSELDDVIEQEKAYYEQRYGEGSWESVLASYGYDEDSWRENEADRLLEEQLMLEVVGDFEVTDADVAELADAQAYVYNGKHAYYVAFSSESEALAAYEALEQLLADEAEASEDEDDEGSDGTDEAADADAGSSDADDDDEALAALACTLEEFSTAMPAAQDAGWNSLSESRDDMSSDFIAALNELEAGQCSAPFADGEDMWAIVYCDETFSVEQDASVDLDSVPDDILAQLESDAYDALLDERFASWMEELTQGSDIVYESMPEGLSYDVNVAIESDDDA